MKSKDYEKIRAAIAEACSVELPPYKDVRRWRKAHAFLEFGPDWTPRVLPLKAPFWRTGRTVMVDIFKYSLRPVFQRLGVPWQPSPISTFKVILVAFTGTLMFVFLAFMLLGIAAIVWR